MLLLGLYLSVYQVVLSNITDAAGFDGAMSGVLVAIYFLGALIMPIVAGEISDRVGKKAMLLAALAVMISGILIVATTSHIVLIGLGIFFSGAGSCTIESLFSSKITDKYPQDSAKFMNYSQMFFCIGAVLGPLMSLVIKSSGGAWKTSMFIAAFLFLLAGGAVLQLPGDKNDLTENDIDRPKTAYSFTLVKDLRFILLFFSMLLYVGAESGLAFFTMDYYKESVSTASGEISLSLYWASMVIGRLIAGVLHRHSKKILIICLASAAVFSALLQLNLPYMISPALFFLTGFGMSAIWPLIMSSCTQTFSSISGTAGGLMTAGGACGGMLVPFLMGLLLTGGIRNALLVVPFCLIIPLVLIILLRRK